MKMIDCRIVKSVLKENGLVEANAQHGKPSARSNPWRTSDGTVVYPNFRHSEMAEANLYSLGDELEAKGVMERRMFMQAVRAAGGGRKVKRNTKATSSKASQDDTSSRGTLKETYALVEIVAYEIHVNAEGEAETLGPFPTREQATEALWEYLSDRS